MTTTTETRPFARAFVDYAATRPDVLCLSADLTASCEADDFRAAYPDRFVSAGMAEQNMMGYAGGLARKGFRPFITTFSVFVTRRPYDQVAMAIAYPNLPVRLIGFLPGVTTPGGVTHQSIDDVALMRVLPNMTVIDVADATEIETIWPLFDAIEGPVFCRMLRGQVPRLFDGPMALDKVRVLTEGEELLVVSSGVCTPEAITAVKALRAAGVDAGHVHVSTLKPLTDTALTERLGRARAGVITVENHSVIGGLGSAVSELVAEAGLGVRVHRLGIQDVFTHGGSREYLMGYYGIDAAGVVAAADELLGTITGARVDGAGEAAPELDPAAKAEAL